MKSKGFLLATAATGAAAFAPSAFAADMPLKAAPAYVPPAANWTGFYIGLHAGANWHQGHNSNVTGYGQAITTHSTGFIGGGQIGYNWQRGNFVFGIEADGSWLSGKGKSPGPAFASYSASNHVRWLATVRPRFGLAVGDTMAYVTAGVAFGGVKNSHTIFNEDPPKSESKTRVGWTVGGGVEHMWTRNVTIALEGLFVDLGRSSVSDPFGNPFKTTRFSNQIVIDRFKMNYKW